MRITLGRSVGPLLLLVAGSFSLQASDESTALPYRVRVSEDKSPVRSGPGEMHYPTDQLDRGTEVEVYRHDPGGWFAIRPPRGSFSMVLADEIELLDDRTARIVRDGARCWVGTRLGEVDQPMWQVRLKRGETLRLLGAVREQYVLEADQPDWVQVAPPAGEFRWMHRDQLDLSTAQAMEGATGQPTRGPADRAPPSATRAPIRSSTSDNRTAESGTEPKLAPPDGPRTLLEVLTDRLTDSGHDSLTDSSDSYQRRADRNSDPSGGWRPANRPLRNFLPAEFERPGSHVGSYDSGSPIAGHTPVPISAEADSRASTSGIDVRSPQLPTGGNAIPHPGPAPPGRENWNASLSWLEVRLTEEVAKDPAQWNLASIATESQQRLAQANDLAERQQLEKLLAKIQRFQRLQDRYRAHGGTGRPAGGGTDERWASLDTPIGDLNSSSQSLANPYDAVGIVNEVVRDNGRIKPTYVLQNAEGQITHHLAPAPGVNLRRYLGRQVGVIGQQGYHQRFALPHVTAEQVIDLQRFGP